MNSYSCETSRLSQEEKESRHDGNCYVRGVCLSENRDKKEVIGLSLTL